MVHACKAAHVCCAAQQSRSVMLCWQVDAAAGAVHHIGVNLYACTRLTLLTSVKDALAKQPALRCGCSARRLGRTATSYGVRLNAVSLLGYPLAHSPCRN